MSNFEVIPGGGEKDDLDRERIERIFDQIRGKLEDASRALDADDRRTARLLLLEASGLLNIDIRLVQGQPVT